MGQINAPVFRLWGRYDPRWQMSSLGSVREGFFPSAYQMPVDWLPRELDVALRIIASDRFVTPQPNGHPRLSRTNFA